MSDEIIEKLKAVQTMPELDALRGDVVDAMAVGEEEFNRVQGAFIKAKNRLRRIPLRDRAW